MQTRSIGSLEVSVVGVGCNNFGRRLDEKATADVVDAALDAGITFFDTADIYGNTESEVLLGRALRGKRDGVVLATKFGMPIDDDRVGAAPEYVRRACEDSLERLDTDRIELYQLHAPDKSVPIADTLGALFELRDAGKVREIGCSNFTATQLDEAAKAAGDHVGFRSVQNQYSLLWRTPEDDGVFDACDRLDLSFLPYYPLANGLLTGKVRPGEPLPANSRLAAMPVERSAHWLSEELMATVGSLLELSHAQVASVIAGATSPAQVRSNAASAQVLDEHVRAALDELTAKAV